MNMISIILPNYNSAKYLVICLDSIVGQSYDDFELICIDDGSDDGSINILNEYAERDNRISVLTQEHKGGGAARNLGLQHASGDYVVFLDSDDFFDPTMLEHTLNRMIETDADICVFGVKNYNDTTGESSIAQYGLRTEYLPEKEVFSWKDIPDFIFNVFQNWPWNKMFRREFLINSHLHFQEIHRTNDLFFTTTALAIAEKITILPEYLVNYRIRQKSNCQSTNYLYPLDFYHAFMALKDYLIENGLYDNLKVSYLNHAVDGCMANLESLEFGDSHLFLFDKLNEFVFNDLGLFDLSEDKVHLFNKYRFNLFRLASKGDYALFLQKRAELYKSISIDLNDKLFYQENDFELKLSRQKDIYETLVAENKAEIEKRDSIIDQHEIEIKKRDDVITRQNSEIDKKDSVICQQEKEIFRYQSEKEALINSEEYKLGKKIISLQEKVKGIFK